MTKCQITCKSLQKSSKCQNFLRVLRTSQKNHSVDSGLAYLSPGVSKSRYFHISILIKYSNFSRFYKKKKWVHFLKNSDVISFVIDQSIPGVFYLPKKWCISWKCALFIKNYLFLKDSILLPCKKIQTSNMSFIKTSFLELL